MPATNKSETKRKNLINVLKHHLEMSSSLIALVRNKAICLSFIFFVCLNLSTFTRALFMVWLEEAF